MPLIVLSGAALLAGILAGWAARRMHLHLADAPDIAAMEVRRHPRLRSAVVKRLSRGRLAAAEATGVALFAAFVVTVVGAFVVGLLSLLLRTDTGLGVDSAVADWGQDEASGRSTDVIRVITYLGDPRIVAILAVVVAVACVIRKTDRDELWAVPFLAVVIAGNSALYNGLKELLDRARPAFEASTADLDPSFPSGHTATAAAGYAAIAFVLARRGSMRVRAWHAGAAVAIAVAVAASRVLLGVHWLTDTVGGLALGWAWCAVVVVAFGGRLLRFGATAEAIGDSARGSASGPPGPDRAAGAIR